MGSYHIAKDITADLASGDLDFNLKRRQGAADYEFFPQAILILPSAVDTADEFKDVVCRMAGNNAPVTLRLASGQIHPVALSKILKAGTTTESIIVFGNV